MLSGGCACTFAGGARYSSELRRLLFSAESKLSGGPESQKAKYEKISAALKKQGQVSRKEF